MGVCVCVCVPALVSKVLVGAREHEETDFGSLAYLLLPRVSPCYGATEAPAGVR